jgi:hypothetical protein
VALEILYIQFLRFESPARNRSGRDYLPGWKVNSITVQPLDLDLLPVRIPAGETGVDLGNPTPFLGTGFELVALPELTSFQVSPDLGCPRPGGGD